MQIIINIIVFILILTTIIVVHEFGHFIAAKFYGVYCGSFSIGMGPKIFSKKGKETEFQIRALPIGGFVTMAGEADQEDNEEFKDVPLERTLKGKKTYQKLVIFLAGVFMNFVLAILVLFLVNLSVGTTPVNKVEVGTIAKNSAAETYGLEVGDVITSIENKTSKKHYLISSFDDLGNSLTKEAMGVSSDSTTIDVTVNRDGQSQIVEMKVSYNTQSEKYILGITQATRKMTFTESIRSTFTTIGAMSIAIVTALKSLITSFSSTVTQMSGPIGIYSVTAQVTESGQIANLFYLMCLLSVNIGIFNLLPIPGLDGAQALIALIEGIVHKELPENIKLGLQLAGLALVLLLMVIITYQDILRLFQ